MPHHPKPPPEPTEANIALLLGAIENGNDAYQQLINGVKTLGSVAQLGADPRPAINGLSGPVTWSAGRLAGWSFRETSGNTAARVRLLDGIGPTAGLIAAFNIAAGASANHWLMPGGITYGAGIYVDILGTVEGAVYLGGTLT